jgi:hypothetical protein
MVNNQRCKTYLGKVTETATQTAQDGALEMSVNLHTLIEAIRNVDGIHMNVRNITIHRRYYSVKQFCCVGIAVQTVGNLVDTVDIAQTVVDEIINQACDDVFGYQVLAPFMAAKRVPIDSDDSDFQFGIESTIRLPQNLLQILNKETESERLQDLFYAEVFRTEDITTVLQLYTWIAIEYVEQRRTVVLR